MPIVSLVEWNRFLQKHPDAHLLQTGEWGELKSGFGWEAVRVIHGETGAQVLFRKLPLGLTAAYIPKMLVDDGRSTMDDDLWGEIDSICIKRRAIFCKIEFDAWEGSLPPMVHGPSSILSTHNIQPARTIVVEIDDAEEDLLARMKQKTR